MKRRGALDTTSRARPHRHEGAPRRFAWPRRAGQGAPFSVALFALPALFALVAISAPAFAQATSTAAGEGGADERLPEEPLPALVEPSADATEPSDLPDASDAAEASGASGAAQGATPPSAPLGAESASNGPSMAPESAEGASEGPPSPAVPAIPEVPPLPPEDAAKRRSGPPYFEPGSPGYYALWYGPEWALVGILGALEIFKPYDLLPPVPALIGPRFDPSDPDPAVLTDPRLDDVIGRSFVREKVPPVAVAAIGLSALAGAGVVDAIRHAELHHTHNLILGGLTAVTVSQLTTNVLKAGFGRLRPDFRDRYRYASCQGLVPRSSLIDCDAVAASGFMLPEDEYFDGYRSFPSGHASSTFAFATYLSLWLGSEFVWAERSSALEASLGALGIGALYGGALYTSASRLADNRHHPEDVAVGAAIGAGVAAAAWFLHFDLAGNARWRGVEVVPGPGDAGVAVAGRF